MLKFKDWWHWDVVTPKMLCLVSSVVTSFKWLFNGNPNLPFLHSYTWCSPRFSTWHIFLFTFVSLSWYHLSTWSQFSLRWWHSDISTGWITTSVSFLSASICGIKYWMSSNFLKSDKARFMSQHSSLSSLKSISRC